MWYGGGVTRDCAAGPIQGRVEFVRPLSAEGLVAVLDAVESMSGTAWEPRYWECASVTKAPRKRPARWRVLVDELAELMRRGELALALYPSRDGGYEMIVESSAIRLYGEQGDEPDDPEPLVGLVQAMTEGVAVRAAVFCGERDLSAMGDPALGSVDEEWFRYRAGWLNVLPRAAVTALDGARLPDEITIRQGGHDTAVVRVGEHWHPNDRAAALSARAALVGLLHPEIDADALRDQWLQAIGARVVPATGWDPDLDEVLRPVLLAEPPGSARQIANGFIGRSLPEPEWVPADTVAPQLGDARDVDEWGSGVRMKGEVVPYALSQEVGAVSRSELDGGDLASLSAMDRLFFFKAVTLGFADPDGARALWEGVGAMLGSALVDQLGGRWIPRDRLEEAAVVIGDRAWLPWRRARLFLQSPNAALEYSLTKFYKVAQRYAREIS